MDAAQLLDLYRAKHLRIAAAESCTGGMIAAAITDIAGSSDVFDRGFVTYSNEAKTELIGVSSELIAHHGAVSVHVAREMAAGALKHSKADVAVAVTGVAGPGGGSEAKPVGLVYLAVARRGADPAIERHQFHGDRAAIRQATVERALIEEAGAEKLAGAGS
jgi:nicotinamide-nucleotide amidase